jgi:serine/threonine protein kinase
VGSLNNYLRSNDLRVSQLIQMCYDIGKGMEYLEKNNVIHRYTIYKKEISDKRIFFIRDLAARNCLIDKKGRIKVADFGLSRSLQADEEYFSQIKEVPVRWWAVEVFSHGLFLSFFLSSINQILSYHSTIYQ